MLNTANRLARWGASATLFIATLVAGATPVAVAQTATADPSAPASPNVVLWDQTEVGDTNGSITVSSKFEQNLANFDSQAADDFAINDNEAWILTQLYVRGIYEGGTGSNQVTSLLVQIYSNNNGLPGSLMISQTVPSGQISGLSTGEFTVNFSPNVPLSSGHYWVSVQAYKPDFQSSEGRQWEWFEKETQVLDASVWRQPGNAYGKNCLTFKPRVSVCDQPTNTDNYDLVFAVYGTRIDLQTKIFMPQAHR
jgi:hypothetical protein